MSIAEINKFVGKPEIVTLVLKTRFPKVRRPVHCMHCGRPIFFTYKTITVVIQGAAAVEEVEHEIECRNCRAIYEIC